MILSVYNKEDLKILRQKSKIFDKGYSELDLLLTELEHNLYESEIKGCGLSAIQIGLPYQVSIIRTNTISLNLYNAQIIDKYNEFYFKNEGCLSIPDFFKNKKRYNSIIVKNGDGIQHSFSGFNAIVIQHEMDHWEGKLLTDD